jgi:hypothetical protein
MKLSATPPMEAVLGAFFGPLGSFLKNQELEKDKKTKW